MSMSSKDSSDDEDLKSTSTSRSLSPSPSQTFKPPQQLWDQYQALLSQTIDIPNLTLAGLLPTQPRSDHGDDEEEMGEGGRAMTKAEKQNAKKRRRKEREREAKLQLGKPAASASSEGGIQEDKGVGFRLFSSCPIRNIKLEGKAEEYPCPSNPRHDPSSEEERIRRRVQAESSAVEYPGLGGPSVQAERWSRVSRAPRYMTTSNRLESSTDLILLEIDSSFKSMVYPTPSTPRKTSRPIPLLEVHPSSAQTSTKATRRSRKGKRKRAEAAYYCPSDELGGKSQITLWGYGVGMPIRSRR